MISRNINITEELLEASKKDYKKNMVNMSVRIRELLTKYYKKQGFM